MTSSSRAMSNNTLCGWVNESGAAVAVAADGENRVTVRCPEDQGEWERNAHYIFLEAPEEEEEEEERGGSSRGSNDGAM